MSIYAVCCQVRRALSSILEFVLRRNLSLRMLASPTASTEPTGSSIGETFQGGTVDAPKTEMVSGELRRGAPRLVSRGHRFYFLKSLASACHINGVEPASILSILQASNSEYCDPPKRGAELEKILGLITKETGASGGQAGIEYQSVGLIRRGERYFFLMFVTSACHENSVNRDATLAIANMVNSICCHPPKREKDLIKIVDWTARNRYSRCRPTDLERGGSGYVPRGERDGFLKSLAWTLDQERIKQPALLRSLRQANSAYCRPPKPDREVRRIVDWASNKRHKRGRERALDPEPIEGRGKTSGGRPKALFAVDGKKIRTLRGDASQNKFCRLCQISVDILQQAEGGLATERTIDRLCAYARKKGQQLIPEDLKVT